MRICDTHSHILKTIHSPEDWKKFVLLLTPQVGSCTSMHCRLLHYSSHMYVDAWSAPSWKYSVALSVEAYWNYINCSKFYWPWCFLSSVILSKNSYAGRKCFFSKLAVHYAWYSVNVVSSFDFKHVSVQLVRAIKWWGNVLVCASSESESVLDMHKRN